MSRESPFCPATCKFRSKSLLRQERMAAIPAAAQRHSQNNCGDFRAASVRSEKTEFTFGLSPAIRRKPDQGQLSGFNTKLASPSPPPATSSDRHPPNPS